jgi:hypothetical protein
MYGLGQARGGEGHAAVDDPDARLGRNAQKIVDALGRLKDLGVTMSSVPIPEVSGVDAYMDYAQWVIEEIKPKLQ